MVIGLSCFVIAEKKLTHLKKSKMALIVGKTEPSENSQTFTRILTGEVRTYLMDNFQVTHRLDNGKWIELNPKKK